MPKMPLTIRGNALRARAKKKKAVAKRRPGAPVKKIDLAELQKLAGLGCTIEDAAGFLDISKQTLHTRFKTAAFREAWEIGKAKGRVSLRMMQMKTAKTSATMQIWLGKQLLGQRDMHLHGGHDGGPIEIADATEQVRAKYAAIASRISSDESEAG